MTIRFVTAWNGYHADQIVSGLGSPEENRLIGLGFSVADIDGPGNTPLPVTATTNLTGGIGFNGTIVDMDETPDDTNTAAYPVGTLFISPV